MENSAIAADFIGFLVVIMFFSFLGYLLHLLSIQLNFVRRCSAIALIKDVAIEISREGREWLNLIDKPPKKDFSNSGNIGHYLRNSLGSFEDYVPSICSLLTSIAKLRATGTQNGREREIPEGNSEIPVKPVMKKSQKLNDPK